VSNTPRTDRARLDEHDPAVAVASECSKLECELNAANRRIKRLEEAGDAVMKSLSCGCLDEDLVFYCQTCTNSWEAWRKAKEAKL
jgi:hypothetical protein